MSESCGRMKMFLVYSLAHTIFTLFTLSWGEAGRGGAAHSLHRDLRFMIVGAGWGGAEWHTVSLK